MKKWQLWAGVLVIFIAGICIGAAGTGLFVKRSIESMLQEGSPAVARLITKKLTHELELSDSQEIFVEQSIRDIQKQLWDVRRRFRPEIEAIVSAGVEQIKTNLSPQQQQKLDELREKFKARWDWQIKNQPNLN